MPWSETALRSLTLPQGAGPTAARVVIGPNIPPEIVTLYTVTLPALAPTGGGTPVACIVGYVGTTTAYQARVWVLPAAGPIFTTEVVYDGVTIREITRWRTGTMSVGNWAAGTNFTVGPFESGLAASGFFLTSLPIQYSRSNITEGWNSVVGAQNCSGFANNWTDAGAGTMPLKFRLNANRMLEIIGVIQSPNPYINDVITIVDAQYRPVSNQSIFGTNERAGTLGGSTHVSVASNGQILVRNAPATPGVVWYINGAISLDN